MGGIDGDLKGGLLR